jgi:hypothetical protein
MEPPLIRIVPHALTLYAAFLKEGKGWKQLSYGPQMSKREALLDLKYWLQSAPKSMDGQTYQYRIMEIRYKVLKTGRAQLVSKLSKLTGGRLR